MPLLDHSNLEEFQDPELYDAENRVDGEGEFFLALATQYGGPVLDVACGTGRLTNMLAAQGFSCVGIDISPAMLDHARRKSQALPVAYVCGDACSFRLERQFRFALMTGHAFQGFITADAQYRALRSVQHHLARAGGFAFETRNPAMRALSVDPQIEWQRSFEGPNGEWFDARCLTRFDPSSRLLHVVQERVSRASGACRRTRIALRFTGHYENLELLAAAGFRVRASYGDWDGRPMSDDTPELIYVCEAS